jgi:Glycerol kinase
MILALDAGTTSTRAILFNEEGRPVSSAQKEFPQYYPKAGYVEHHGNEIWQAELSAAREAVEKSGIHPSKIQAIGITNQRETTLVWDRATGIPIYPAIVWQCRRTTEMIEKMTKEDPSTIELIKEKTGLVFDPYFSATKLSWILDHVEGAEEKTNINLWKWYKVACYRIVYRRGSRNGFRLFC